MSNSNRKVNLQLNKKITNINGVVYKHKIDNKEVDMKLGKIIASTLGGMTSVKDPMRVYRLCMKIMDSDNTYSTDEDEVDFIIENWIKSEYPPIIKGQVLDILEEAKLESRHPKKEKDN